jgi:hypothetical protein
MKVKNNMFILILVICLSVFRVSADIQQTSAPQGELRFTAPAEWIKEQPSSKMRTAQYKLPRADGDKEDASLVIYYFGSSGGGSASANIERWISQMEQPDGSSAKDKAKTEILTVNGLKLNTIDLTGTYTAEMSPGSTEHHNDPNFRLRAAVIETPKGFYYMKLVGPEKTIARWQSELDKLIKSFEFK